MRVVPIQNTLNTRPESREHHNGNPYHFEALLRAYSRRTVAK